MGKTLQTTNVTLPKEVVTEISGKMQDDSVIAKLSTSRPQIFKDVNSLLFTPSAEAEIVGEGMQMNSYQQKMTPIEGKRIKIVATTRVSEELQIADEDDQLDILKNIMDDQGAAMGRALDAVVFHALNPLSGTALDGYTALTSQANIVNATEDIHADMDSLADALDEYEINGLGLSRKTASEMRKLTYPATGTPVYPDIKYNFKMGNVNGLNTIASNTISWPKASAPTNVKAIMGDYNQIKWGIVRNMQMKQITSGDPDGLGDLQRLGQVAYRTVMYAAYTVIDPKAFAVLKTGLSA